MDLGDLFLGAFIGVVADRIICSKSEKYKETTEKPVKYVIDKTKAVTKPIEDLFSRRKYVIAGKQFLKTLNEVDSELIKGEQKAFKKLHGSSAMTEHLYQLGKGLEEYGSEKPSEIIDFAALGVQEWILRKKLKGEDETVINKAVSSAKEHYQTIRSKSSDTLSKVSDFIKPEETVINS